MSVESQRKMDDSEIRVLLIEDNPVDAAVIRSYLETAVDLSTRLEHVCGLSAGLNQLAANRFDVILLDLGLPESIGLETLGFVQPQSGNVPIVVLTGLDEDEIAVEAVQMGADDYLTKNRLDSHLLIRAIRYAIERARRRRAEEALADSEETFRVLFESSRDAIMVFDRTGFVDCNKATLDAFGCSTKGQFISKHPADYSPPKQADGEDSFAASEKYIAAAYETSPQFFEWLHRRTDGTVFPAEVLLSSCQVHGRVVLQAVVRDITERKRAQEALERERRTLEHLLRSSDHERQLIAYEIHDGLAQQLAGAIMQFQTHAHLREVKPQRATKAYDAAMTMLQQAHFEVRRLISDVRPPILDESGIVAAIAHLVHEQRHLKGPKIEFHSKVEFGRLDSILENAIYRIVQEGLTNACRHSKSKKVRVELMERDHHLLIEIQDWGIGFPPNAAKEGCFGLEGIRQRARLLGGSCVTDSVPGSGTRIIVELPVIPKTESA